ncbi:hypothetical protein [Sphingorhabdus sp. 109]|uniref:hypothetical protein n=1 Tax=Sphingorhabdus sp. 109 TaxID=2653173 RepID=UPI0012EFFBBB|nr:hypothetical protein [Sphingorhabdus sp. 109]VWX62550.1 conserved hypothetical protein [Sphingorhabdus sp. 109]
MNPLSYLKIGGGILGIVALASMAWLAKDRFAQKERADAADDCAAVAFKLTGDLDDCLPAVKSAITEYRRSETCDAGLSSQPAASGTFAVQQACSTEVKAVVAQRDAAKHNQDDAERLLAELKKNSLAAIERAETRAANITKRTNNAIQTIEAAPRGDDGLVVCDDACLRNIAG